MFHPGDRVRIADGPAKSDQTYLVVCRYDSGNIGLHGSNYSHAPETLELVQRAVYMTQELYSVLDCFMATGYPLSDDQSFGLREDPSALRAYLFTRDDVRVVRAVLAHVRT